MRLHVGNQCIYSLSHGSLSVKIVKQVPQNWFKKFQVLCSTPFGEAPRCENSWYLKTSALQSRTSETEHFDHPDFTYKCLLQRGVTGSSCDCEIIVYMQI